MQQEPVLVRSCPTLLFYGQFVMAASLGAAYAQCLLSNWIESPQLEYWLWGFVLMWLFKPLIAPIFRAVGAGQLPPGCPVCAKKGGWWHPQAWMAAFGDPAYPDNWQRIFFCPSCREAAWVYTSEFRIVYTHPPEFSEQAKVYRQNFVSGHWNWESAEELAKSACPTTWKLVDLDSIKDEMDRVEESAD